jgi:hypothetical protein
MKLMHRHLAKTAVLIILMTGLTQSSSLIIDTVSKKPPVWKTIDKEELRKSLPDSIESRQYILHFSQQYHSIDTLIRSLSQYDTYCDSVIKILNLPAPSYRIDIYLYDSETKKYDLMGWQSGAQAFPPHEIHTLILAVIPHETAHILFNNENKYWGSPSFLNEGVARFVEYKLSLILFQSHKLAFRKYLDQPLEKWITGAFPFFEAPEYDDLPATYIAAGLFVYDLVETYGLNRYKNFHRNILINTNPADFEKAFNDSFGITIQSYVEKWKQTMAPNQQLKLTE